jgi:DNA-binding Lrp family transcriptional regulator
VKKVVDEGDKEKIVALCFIQLEHAKIDEVVSQMKNIPKVKHYSVITGEYDGVIELEVDTTSELYETFKLIDKIPGIRATNTHIVMKRLSFG